VKAQLCAPTLPYDAEDRSARAATSRALRVSLLLLAFLAISFASAQAADLIFAREFRSIPALPAEKVAFLPPADIIKQPPSLDGRFLDECWRGAPFIDIGSDMPGGTLTRATSVRVVRDASALYFAFQGREPTIAEMPPGAAPEHDVWSAENVQIMIKPGESAKNAFVFAVGLNGSKYEWSLREGLPWSCEWDAKTTRSSTAWNAEIMIPLASLGVESVKDGDLWLFNLARDSVASGEECSWSPTNGNRRNALQWGRLYFGGIEEYRKLETPPRLFIFPERWLIRDADSAFRVVISVDPGSMKLDEARLRIAITAERQGASLPEPQTLTLTGELASLLLNVDALPVGRFNPCAEILGKDDSVLQSAEIALSKRGAPREPTATRRLKIDVPKLAAKTRTARIWPISTGVALPRGALMSPENVRMLGPDGKEVPCQALVRARDPSDGSIRWLGLDFRADLLRSNSAPYTLEYGPDVSPMPFKGFVRKETHLPFDASVDKWAINTGPLFFAVSFKQFSGVTEAWMDVDGNGHYDWTEQIINATRGNVGPYAVSSSGWVYRLLADPACKVELEEWNELRLVLRGEGRLVLDRAASTGAVDGDPTTGDLGRCTVRITAYAGLPFVRMQYKFIFNKRTVTSMLTDLGVKQKLDFGQRGFEAVFGVPGGFRKHIRDTGDVSLLQLQPGKFLIQNHSDEAQAISVEGTGAENWACAAAANRGFAACLRDMGQLFPKEIELNRKGEFNVHFWPRHGSENQRMLRGEVNRRTVGALGFAHAGTQLDFAVPPLFSRGLADREGLADFDAVENMHLSDPTGIAPSYDVLYMFYSGDFPQDEIAEISRLFQLRLHAVQDLASLKASGVLAGVLPKARSERAAAVAKRLFELEDRNRQAGDFNFQDVHSRWLPDERRWALRDHWVGTGDDLPAALWLTYLQTGKPELLRAAERSMRPIVAFDFCNSASDAQAAITDPRRRKIAGAFGDRQTPVHWQSTCHVNDRFARIRGMMLAYYLTGDPLAREAAELWGEAARTYGVPNSGEDGAVFLENLSEVLLLQYDPVILERLGHCAEYLFGMPFEPKDYAGSAYLLRAYANARSDPRVAALLKKAAPTAPATPEDAVETFEKNADAFLSGRSGEQGQITWRDFCQYVFGAVEGK